jgi:hypothetical protein
VVGAGIVLLHVCVEMPLYSEMPFSGERTRETYAAAARTWAAEQLETWARARTATGGGRVVTSTRAPTSVSRQARALSATRRSRRNSSPDDADAAPVVNFTAGRRGSSEAEQLIRNQ